MKKWESPILIETGQVILAADMDNDCIPELIVRKFTTDPNLPRDTFKIAFLDSRNGHLKKEFVCAPYFIANSSMTVVDIDNDGIKEIIFARSPGSSHHLAVMELLSVTIILEILNGHPMKHIIIIISTQGTKLRNSRF